MLNSWIYTNNYYKPSEEAPEATHLRLDGGSCYIPYSCHDEFLYKYAQQMKNKKPLYLVEVRPRIFKFMIDFDILDDHFWTNLEIFTMTKFVSKIVNSKFDNFMSIICKSTKEKKKEGGIHTGMHLIFPKLYVNADTALVLRTLILKTLHQEEPVIDPENLKVLNDIFSHTKIRVFNDIIDERIYLKNGYRMVGSDKIVKIKDKNGEEIKKGEDRIYWPIGVLSGQGEFLQSYLTTLLTDYYHMISETSIRNVPSYVQFNLPEGYLMKVNPEWYIKTEDVKYKHERKTYAQLTGHINEIVSSFIYKNAPEYGQDIVKHIVTAENDGRNIYFVAVSTKYCSNIEKEHNSCGIYFIIDGNVMYQRCFCTCDTLRGRKNGFCSGYRSKHYLLSKEIKEELYPVDKIFTEVKEVTEQELFLVQLLQSLIKFP